MASEGTEAVFYLQDLFPVFFLPRPELFLHGRGGRRGRHRGSGDGEGEPMAGPLGRSDGGKLLLQYCESRL